MDSKNEGVLDEALLIVTSDYGGNLGEDDLACQYFRPHDTSLHVPMMMVYPGVVPAAKDCQHRRSCERVPHRSTAFGYK